MKNQKCRLAFQQGKKSSLQQSIDDVLIQIQLKMKEMVSKKKDIISKRNLIIGQQNTLKNEIQRLKAYIETKDNDIQIKQQEITELQEENKKREEEFKNQLNNSKNEDLKIKEVLNKINSDLENVKYGTLSANSLRKAEIKQKLETLLSEKERNKFLSEKLFNLSHNLNLLEVYFYITFSHNIVILFLKKKTI